jgi:hypothetical protein
VRARELSRKHVFGGCSKRCAVRVNVLWNRIRTDPMTLKPRHVALFAKPVNKLVRVFLAAFQ